MGSTTIKTHCKNGHEFTEENIYRPPNSNERQCRQCKRDSRKRNYDSQKRRREYLANKERHNESSKRWYQTNKQRHKALMARWYRENAETHRKLQHEWYIKNRAKHLKATSQWSANNLDRKALYRANRRVKIKNAPGRATTRQLKDRIDYYGRRCAYCQGPFEEIDHAIPLSRGGSNWPANLMPSCLSCNRRKFMKTIWEYLSLPVDTITTP